MKENTINSLSLSISISLLTGIFTLFMLSSIGFIFNISINLGYSLIAILSSIFISIKYNDFKVKKSLITLIIVTLLVLFSASVSGSLMDFSYDGQWYHQSGIIFLKKGWNPIYTTAETFFKNNWNANITGLVWIESYPKFYEIFAANIYYLTNNIETGKMLNLLSMFMLFFYANYVLTQNLLKEKRKVSTVLSLLLTINPVFLAQIYTYYADGLVYIYFMMMILAITDIEQSKSHKPFSEMILVISAIVLANLKFGGLAYAMFILISYAGYKFIYKKELKSFSKLIGLVILGIFLTGINPYITNLCQKKHILHPIAGAEKIDIMKHNMPSQFFNKPMPYKLFMSTFSQVDNLLSQYIMTDKKITLKIPFTINVSEMENLKLVDARQGGFGVFWSGILLMSILLSFFIRFKNKQIKKTFFLSIGIILASVLLNSENWWARYVPQFYAVPVFISLYYLIFSFSKTRYIVTNILSVIIIFNSILIYVGISLQTIDYTAYKSTQLRNMENLKRNPNMIRDLESSNIREDFTAPVLIFLDKYKRK